MKGMDTVSMQGPTVRVQEAIQGLAWGPSI